MKIKYSYTIGFTLLIFNICSAQRLQDYLNIAKANSSEIQEKHLEYVLFQEKVNETGNLEDTYVSVGPFVSTPETRVGAQIIKFGIEQRLPWFGTFNAEKSYAEAISETKQFDANLAERELLFQVKTLYYELYQKYKIEKILKDNKQILTTYENMALSALENNKATMSDVLKIKVQKNELHSNIFKNLNEIEALNKNFNRLLQQDINTQIVIVDSLSVLDIMMEEVTINSHPSLSKIEIYNKVYQAENDLIDKEKRPTLSFGLDYILVEERQDLKLNDNGKDIVMPKIALSIPIFTKKYTSKSAQVKIKQESLHSKKETQKKQLEMALQTSSLELDNAILNVVAAQKNTVETQIAIDVDLKAYETGILDYDKILNLQLQKIKFQLMEIKGVKEAFVAKAKMEYLTK
ncbi:TolC family protein [Pontimicrobium aquaticum]|uniref:TolC family protein n=1 Tax=Pontimicrobium aquaticum TaxID=2565367 RepID=A0A4U0EYV5_9FLAO|nr:TolC family protein [Pontimicrobium aquaticum]TJY37098.1 TolC family protein [Pontimicrobium aquaticum]